MKHEDLDERVLVVVAAIVFIALAIVALIGCTFCGIWIVKGIIEML